LKTKEMAELPDVLKVTELMRLVQTYSEITKIPLEDCVAQALTAWLIDPAYTVMTRKLLDAEVRHYLEN